jgi:glycosyltransferase involved in cell wall biosynthesis
VPVEAVFARGSGASSAGADSTQTLGVVRREATDTVSKEALTGRERGVREVKLDRSVEGNAGLELKDGGASRPKVLFVCHNHWDLLAGGVESYVAGVYDRFGDSPEFEPYVLARAGQPYSPADSQHAEAPLAMVGADPHQYLLYTDFSQFDYQFGRLTKKDVLTRSFRDFLLALRPDLVHFHHTLYMGYDLIRITKNALPEAPLVYSLHEYIPICHRDGVMVRTLNDELCQEESPRRCHECFPNISPQTFYMRKRFIQSHMSLVDHFIAPTDYVRERYVDWGIPAEKIQVEPQGMMPVTDKLPDEGTTRPRNRFAFFGQLNPYKGADVLLEAMEILGPDFDGHLTIYGANLEIQPIEFRKRFDALFDADSGVVKFAGPYERSRLAGLMAGIDWVVVPSIWWETGPIVVMEAFQYGRPVICSDIGGMSEKVTDGVNGLHFRRKDPEQLAEAMQRAAETPGLWEELRAGIPAEPPRWMDDHVAILSDLYRRLLAERSAVRETLEQAGV